MLPIFNYISVVVKYIAKETRLCTIPKDRESIWSSKGEDLRNIGTYQPETDDYEIGLIRRGTNNLES